MNGYVTRSYVVGDPTIISKSGGRIPAGLSFDSGVLSGTVTTVESLSLQFEATNSAGSTNSEWIEFNISAAAPVSATPSPAPAPSPESYYSIHASGNSVAGGGSLTFMVTTSTAYSSIDWYVCRPGQPIGDGSFGGDYIITASGDGTVTSSTIEYSYPDVAGSYTVEAYITYTGGTRYYESVTVIVR